MGTSFYVRGEPYPFATPGERGWRETIAKTAHLRAHGANEKGMILDMRYDPARHGGYADIDNLCEPVFSVLIGQMGWFGGKRSNVTWWRASKRISVNEGVGVDVQLSQELRAPEWERREKVFDVTYQGRLPKNATDADFACWVRSNLRATNEKHIYSSSWAVQLQFGDPHLNICEIATGPVKASIDCLYPLIGGVAGKPADHRIVMLQVEKGGATGVRQSALRVVVDEWLNLPNS